MRREEDPVRSTCLGRAKQGAHVLGILEMVEHEHERRLPARPGQRQDLVQGRPAARCHHQRHALVALEAADGGDGAAFDLDHGDAQGRGVEHQSLERSAPLGHDEQAPGFAAGREGLLDGSPAGHHLLVLTQHVRGRDPGQLAWWPVADGRRHPGEGGAVPGPAGGEDHARPPPGRTAWRGPCVY
jgi:hypothetical protein